MATINVNGGSLQAAIDGAQTGDTLILAAGTYAGPIDDRSKQLTIQGDGGAWISGSSKPLTLRTKSSLKGVNVRNCTAKLSYAIGVLGPDVSISDCIVEESLGYGIRQYHTDRLTLNRVTIRKVAHGVQVDRGGGSVFNDVTVSQIDRMFIDDGTLATNGGDGFVFYNTTSTITLNRPKVIGARAKTYGGSSWAYDGSAFEGYGLCAPVLIYDWEVRDSVNICEVGTDSSQAGVPTGWVFKNGDAYSNNVTAPGWDKNCEGFYLRANKDFQIINNRIHMLDDYFVVFATGGSYGGIMTGNKITDNEIWLKPGPSGNNYAQNQAYIVGAGVNTANFGIVDRNKVYFDSQNPTVATVSGKGGTKDLATWRTWTGWGANDVWGNPVPIETPLQKATRERDEALAALATANANLAAANSALTTANAALTTANSNLAAANSTIQQLQATIDSKNTVINKLQDQINRIRAITNE